MGEMEKKALSTRLVERECKTKLNKENNLKKRQRSGM